MTIGKRPDLEGGSALVVSPVSKSRPVAPIHFGLWRYWTFETLMSTDPCGGMVPW